MMVIRLILATLLLVPSDSLPHKGLLPELLHRLDLLGSAVDAQFERADVAKKVLARAMLDGKSMVVWDFDKTLLKIHAFSKRVKLVENDDGEWGREGKGSEEMFIPWSADVADLELFRAFLEVAEEEMIPVAVASFGTKPRILEYLNLIAPHKFSAENVLTPNDIDKRDGSEVPGGKRLMLDKLMDEYGLVVSSFDDSAKKEVLFFDDSKKNVEDCWSNGYTGAMHVPDAFKAVMTEGYPKIPKIMSSESECKSFKSDRMERLCISECKKSEELFGKNGVTKSDHEFKTSLGKKCVDACLSGVANSPPGRRDSKGRTLNSMMLAAECPTMG